MNFKNLKEKIKDKQILISIIYGLSNSISMTVIGNLIGSTLDRIILNIKNKQNYHILPDKNDIFDKRTFSSISNLFNITSFIGGFLLHSTRIQNIHFITVLLLTFFVFIYNLPNIEIPIFDILILMLSFIVFYCGSGFLTLIPIMNICQYWPELQGFISSLFIIFGDFVVSVVIWVFYPKKNNNNIALDNSLKIKYLFLIILYFIPISISTGIMYKFESDFDKDSKINDQQNINIENNSKNDKKENINYDNKKRSKTISFIREFNTYDYWGSIFKNYHVLKMGLLFFITLIAFIGCELIYSYSSYFKYIDYTSKEIKIDNRKFFQKFEYTRIIAWIAVLLFGYISDITDFNETVYIINLLGLFINIFILFSCLVGFRKTKFIFHFLEIIEYGLISGFFSIFLGKIMKVFKTSFLMEITGIIAIAPLLVQMIRCIIQESVNPFNYFEFEGKNANEFYDKCYFLKDKTTYCYFGAWIFFTLDKSEKIFIFSSLISIIFNIMAIIIIKILITKEIGVIEDKKSKLDVSDSFSEEMLKSFNKDE